jgi:hypothetical protein
VHNYLISDLATVSTELVSTQPPPVLSIGAASIEISLFCVNQWEKEKYFILFRYWLESIYRAASTEISLFCVNQWEEDKFFVLFRYWLESLLVGILPVTL